MADQKRRGDDRAAGWDRLEVVTVYPDWHDLPYETLTARLNVQDVYHIFAVVGLVRDVSQQGLGIKLEGQSIMAQNILKPGQQCVLKLTVTLPAVPPELTPYVKSDASGNYSFLLLKARCRWHHEGQQRTAAAGFELLESNPPAVTDFIQQHFKIGE